MAHYGTLQDYRFTDADAAHDDIRGSKIYGRDDEKLGKIDDVIFDHSSGAIRYVVVDTGGWLSSKKFIIPADRLRSSAEHEDDFRIGLSKQQVENFPPYNESDVNDEDKWADYENKYRSRWETGPVMHRAETDRNITPTTAQMTQGTGATGPMVGETSGRSVSSSPTGVGSEISTDTPEDVAAVENESRFASGTSTATSETATSGVNRSVTPIRTNTDLEVGPQGPGRRWSTFEDRLRQRRAEIVASCAACGTQPTSEHLRERERKVG
jgi:sporulation protein YlmC with PRC-barrel domain